MYAVIKTGGKQYKVAAGEKIKVEQIAADVGQEIVIRPGARRWQRRRAEGWHALGDGCDRHGHRGWRMASTTRCASSRCAAGSTTRRAKVIVKPTHELAISAVNG